MIIKKDKQLEVDSNVVFEGHDATISKDDMHKLWDLLQDPYKNPTGAVVREYVSNSFDAHAEVGVTDAVHVRIGKDSGGEYWSTEDFGVGLSPERMKDVFCSYLKSTKENSNEMIGAFGIGSKSGLSYTDVVHIRTRFDGIEYTYMLRKGEKTPRLDKIFEEPTTERNGSLIKIYFKGDSWVEKRRFQEECKKQLSYFDNVYFEDCGIDNKYTIYQGKHWKYNPTVSPFSGMHLCLGKVAYPIDWDNLPIDRYEFPVALKFEIGELDIIQTREDVKYTPRTKKAICDKVKEVIQEFKDRWNNTVDLDTDDIFNYLENRNERPILKIDKDRYLHLRQLGLRKDDLKWYNFTPLDGVDIKIPDYPFFDYHSTRRVRNGKLSKHSIDVRRILNQYVAYRIKESPIVKKNRYIQEELENGEEVFLIRKNAKHRLKDYVRKLSLKWDDRENWRTKISAYQKAMMTQVIKFTKQYDTVVPSPEWISANKAAKRTIGQGKIVIKELNQYGYNDSWVRRELDLSKLSDKKFYLIGLYEERETLGSLFKMFGKKNNPHYKCYTVAKTNLKHFKELNNVWTVEKLMSNESKAFRRAMTACKIIKEYPDILDLRSEQWSFVYEKLGNLIHEIQAYRRKNRVSVNDTFLKVCIALAEEQDLFDYDMLDKAKFVQGYLEDLELLKYLDRDKDLPIEAVARYIYDYNRSTKDPKRYKRMNTWFYIKFNEHEVKWLKANKKEYELYNHLRKVV